MQYLVDEGIEPKRLTAKGYGEFRPLISDQKIKKMKTEEKKIHKVKRYFAIMALN